MSIKPKKYFLHLEPNLDEFTSPGEVKITVELERPQKEIQIHAVDLEIQECNLISDSSSEKLKFELNEKNQTLTLLLPEEKSGEFTLHIKFVAQINDTMLGLYRSSYKDENGEKKYIAVTQFEEREARKAFPCFDEPDKKAIFDIEYVIDKELTGVSCMPISSEEELEGNKKLVKFEPTPPMSTYLLFFGIGEFEINEMEDQDKPILRVLTPPGKSQYTDKALTFMKKSVDYCEEHFGTEYPLPKLDSIAVADFAFGAMENFGAMTFRENLLLVYPNITSKKALQRIYGVIAHEIVHMWFGDLVSPTEWKYLWLNESFATLYGDMIVDHYYPQWNTMDSYLISNTAQALNRDSLKETFPIELDKEAKITASTAPIIYSKGGSILWMVIDHLGDEIIRKILKTYFDDYAFGNANSDAMWSSFGKATGSKATEEMMRSWVEQPGFPLITVSEKDGSLRLEQQRFTYLDEDFDQHWIIPISIWILKENEETQVIKRLMKDDTLDIELDDDVIAYKLNHNQTGYYRVKYPDEGLGALEEPIKSKKTLMPRDRYGIHEDLYALLLRGDISLEEYLIYVESNYINENHFLPLKAIVNTLMSLYRVFKGTNKQSFIGALGKKISDKNLERINLEPQEDEPFAITDLRGTLLWASAMFDSDKTIEFAQEQFRNLIKTGEKIHPDISDSIYRIAAYTLDHGVEQLIEEYDKIETEHERSQIAMALGYCKNENMSKALEFALENIPPRLQAYPMMMATRNPKTKDDMWSWYQEHINQLEKMNPSFYERIVMFLITSSNLGKTAIPEFFGDYQPEAKTLQGYPLQDSINMALEIRKAREQLLQRHSNEI